MGGRYGGAAWRPAASQYAQGTKAFAGPAVGRFAGPILEMEKIAGVWQLAQALPILRAAEREAELLSRFPFLNYIRTGYDLYQLLTMILRMQSSPEAGTGIGTSFSLTGFSHFCGPRDPGDYLYELLGPNGLPGTPTCGGVGSIGEPLVPGRAYQGVVTVIHWLSGSILAGTFAQFEGWKADAPNSVPLKYSEVPPQWPYGPLDPRPWVQGLNPELLPIGRAWPLPETVPAEFRVPNSLDWPDPLMNPRFVPHGEPVAVPSYEPEFGPLPAYELYPRVQPVPVVEEPMFPVRVRPKDKEKKVRGRALGVALRIGHLVGHFTEADDFLRDLWDAIPKKECKPGEGGNRPLGWTVQGADFGCGGQSCTGKKIKYDPPLHLPKSRKVKDQNGAWHTVPTVDRRKGRPITHPTTENMLLDVFNHWSSINACQAVNNIVNDQAKDLLFGTLAKGPKKTPYGVRRGQLGLSRAAF